MAYSNNSKKKTYKEGVGDQITDTIEQTECRQKMMSTITIIKDKEMQEVLVAIITSQITDKKDKTDIKAETIKNINKEQIIITMIIKNNLEVT